MRGTGRHCAETRRGWGFRARPLRRSPRRPGRLRSAALTVTSTVAISSLGALTAMAYWTTTGSGSGTGTLSDWDISATAGSVSGLGPGQSQPLVFTVTNEGTVPFQVETVTPRVIDVDPSSCPQDAVTVTVPGPMFLIPASYSIGFVSVVAMRADAPDVCQGAQFEIRFTVDGHDA